MLEPIITNKVYMKYSSSIYLQILGKCQKGQVIGLGTVPELQKESVNLCCASCSAGTVKINKERFSWKLNYTLG